MVDKYVYQTLGSIINNSDEGLFLIVANEAAQKEICQIYDNNQVGIYDYKKEQKEYSFVELRKWTAELENTNTIFLMNLQLAIRTPKAVQSLNFSRDMLTSLNKNIVFFLTKFGDDTLTKTAYDLYSYFKLRIVVDEVKELEKYFPSDVLDGSKLIGDTVNVAISEKNDSKQDDVTKSLSQAVSLMRKAEEAYNQREYIENIELLNNVLHIRKEILGEYHSDTANTYEKLGEAYEECFYYSQALQCFKETIKIREKVLGEDHPDTARTYNNMAVVYERQGDYEKALKWAKKALEIDEKVLGKEHPFTATAYNNMAVVYNRQGDYEKALKWYKKALEIREKVLGKEHPDTATTYNNMAGMYGSQGDYEKALEWYKKALEIFETRLGEEHPNTVAVKRNIDVLSTS